MSPKSQMNYFVTLSMEGVHICVDELNTSQDAANFSLRTSMLINQSGERRIWLELVRLERWTKLFD